MSVLSRVERVDRKAQQNVENHDQRYVSKLRLVTVNVRWGCLYSNLCQELIILSSDIDDIVWETSWWKIIH
jgi:hypothetical protein